MHYSIPYLIPDVPPAELLAELDAAARALDELSARAAQLTLGMDEHTRGLRIELEERRATHGSRRRSSSTCSPSSVGARLQRVSSTPDAEVVIVGAGVMGLATARALARAGRDVVVCEQFEVGHKRGSSHGGSRIVRLSYPDER